MLLSIQSVGLLKAVYTFPPLADLFIPTPTRLLLEKLRNDYSLTCPPLYIVRYSCVQLCILRLREENENAQPSKLLSVFFRIPTILAREQSFSFRLVLFLHICILFSLLLSCVLRQGYWCNCLSIVMKRWFVVIHWSISVHLSYCCFLLFHPYQVMYGLVCVEKKCSWTLPFPFAFTFTFRRRA